MKGRSSVLFVLIMIVLVVIASILLRGTDKGFNLFGRTSDTPALPLDLQPLIPTGWDVQAEPQLNCDFDGDGTPERLLIYRYNPTSLGRVPPGTGDPLAFAPFGGVIYDVQADTLQPQPDSPGPYRPLNLVPYRLLPDYYAGKGQGYLGETKVEMRYWPGLAEGANCKTTEIYIFGYSGGELPTRLSIFRWSGPATGYQGPHFAGNARIDIGADEKDKALIDRVTTYNRLLNHRSFLCEVTAYSRVDGAPAAFAPTEGSQSVDFCFGTPAEPVYPEGVVVALLRGRQEGAVRPVQYLLNNAVVAPELDLRRSNRLPVSIISVGNPSSIEQKPGSGQACTAAQVGTPPATAEANVTPSAAGTLWCGRERVSVKTRILLNGSVREAVWTLTSVASDRPNSDLIWRIEEVELS